LLYASAFFLLPTAGQSRLTRFAYANAHKTCRRQAFTSKDNVNKTKKVLVCKQSQFEYSVTTFLTAPNQKHLLNASAFFVFSIENFSFLCNNKRAKQTK